MEGGAVFNFLFLLPLILSANLGMNFLFADSVVLPTEKYDTLPLPPMTHDLIKQEYGRQQEDTLNKIEEIIVKRDAKKELSEEDTDEKQPVKKKKKSTEKKSKSGEAGTSKTSGGTGLWDSLKNPQLERVLRTLIDDQYQNLYKYDKTVSLNFKKVDIKKAFELISKTSGIQIFVDSDVQGTIENIDLKNIHVASALRLLTTSNNPILAVLWENGAIRIAKLSTAIESLKTEAMDILDRDYKNVCITIYHTKWNEELKKRLSNLWKGIVGESSDKNCNYIVFDDESKKILCHARQAQIDSFKEFISKIDIEIPQVKIDARIVIASKDFEEALGFDWSGYYDKRGMVTHTDFAGFGAKLNPTDDPTFSNAVNWAMNFVPSLHMRSIPIRLPFIWGNKNFDSNRVNLILQAAENKNQIRTILKPSLLVNNDELAEILVGQQMPHETKIAETVEGQPSNVTTTQYKDIGMSVKIKSIISPDKDSVFMDIFVEYSYLARPRIEFDTLPGPGSKNYNYIIETSRSKNRVLLKSGQTTMIGGLIINTEERIQTGVPFLQDIPILGFLFKARRKAVIEKQLMIFITPTIDGINKSKSDC